MKAPVSDPTLGPLRFDDGLNWYEGLLPHATHGQIPFTISLDAQPSADYAIQEARLLVPLLADSLESARVYACESLLSVKYDEWLVQGEAPIDEAAFVSQLSVESIGVYAEREAEFFFRGGSLFSGHTVVLSWSPVQGFYGATIAG